MKRKTLEEIQAARLAEERAAWAREVIATQIEPAIARKKAARVTEWAGRRGEK